MSNGEEVNEDPFRVDKLILDYDYLIYRIKDHVLSIHLETTDICRKQNKLITEGIVEDIIDANIKGIEELLQKCGELEKYFVQLNAIDSIVGTFRERLDSIIKQYYDIKVHNERISEDNTTTK
ncbi:Cnl1p Ecym_5515 [Eremothecium cymbalariae DBVPG|uniref:Biogenesis of lysosome-related organelles complex 1 subunit CNL1 n=1 Tax=Eremothecium cymbalariae (strain CBS 270.75 / DBVPG 7215 / KCTC 17166 / NRRL Y-17582) TaxID=931890 RepID=I6NDW5_ERECY|nr:hypothetical protein Ecym_5515 [Eremothecium cymbalariae DBVPG\